MLKYELLKEHEELVQGLQYAIKVLHTVEDDLNKYEIKNQNYPTLPICKDEALDCPSWYIFNALCDVNKALKLLEKEGQENA